MFFHLPIQQSKQASSQLFIACIGLYSASVCADCVIATRTFNLKFVTSSLIFALSTLACLCALSGPHFPGINSRRCCYRRPRCCYLKSQRSGLLQSMLCAHRMEWKSTSAIRRKMNVRRNGANGTVQSTYSSIFIDRIER